MLILSMKSFSFIFTYESYNEIYYEQKIFSGTLGTYLWWLVPDIWSNGEGRQGKMIILKPNMKKY